MPTIRLYVCSHQPAQVPEHPLLVPIQVGAALSGERFPGFLQDDTGDHISEKNRSYCELTAQYWAWKNETADYYGFFHYRRYLYPDLYARRPYRIAGAPSLPLLERLGYKGFAELIGRYDLILPKGENMHLPVREHYAGAPFHHRKDLALAEEILRERHPELTAALEEYLSGTVCCFGNMFIMRRGLFQDYCAWLFPILEEFDRRADTSGYSPQERRVDGYLAERLLGVWAAALRRSGGLACAQLPRVHFIPKVVERQNKRLLNVLLPPGSHRRTLIKSIRKFM